MARFHPQRRKLLKVIGSWAVTGLGLLFLGRFLLPSGKGRQAEATVSDKELPVNGAMVLPRKKIALIKMSGEVYALSLVCTHLGCTVEVNASRIACPCHGSLFDHRGEVVRGPASRPLARHEVRLEGGEYRIYAKGTG